MVSEIAGALAAQNVQLGAGSIEEGIVEYSIKTSGEYDSVAAIANTVVAQVNGADIRLGDRGDAVLDYAEEGSAAYINGEPGVYLSIIKQSGTNTVQVAEQVYQRLDGIRKILPQGLSLDIIQDETTQIRAMILELVPCPYHDHHDDPGGAYPRLRHDRRFVHRGAGGRYEIP
jgi:HAE1 family hydrophobic/amphiphilic exporter-1